MKPSFKSVFNISTLIVLLAALIGSAVQVTPAFATVGTNVSINDVTQSEGNAGITTFTFTVTSVEPAPAGGITFDIATADNNATQPSDYTQKALTGQTIPQGNFTYSFDVLVNGDTSGELSEAFFVNLTNVTGTGVNVTDSQGQGTITNDDAVTQPGPGFIVNVTNDTNDGICDLLGQGSYNQDCTLREAINAANALAGADTITFDSSLSGSTVTLGSALPGITEAVTVDGSALASQISIDGNNAHRVFHVVAVNAEFDNLTIKNGYRPDYEYGGGIYADGGAGSANTVTVKNSTFDSNHSNRGGAINAYNMNLVVLNSTFVNNLANLWGGGVAVLDTSDSHSPTAIITNSTFFNNTATGGRGGAVQNYQSSVTLYNDTLYGNSQGVDIVNGQLGFANTIIAGSTGSDCSADPNNVNNEIYHINLNSNNIIEDGTCTANSSNYQSGDPLLNALANNGGPTKTMGLKTGSPAIDMGHNATCSSTTNVWSVNGKDQRGNIRDATCDIGSYEFTSGSDTVGVFRPDNGALYLKNANTTGFADYVLTYGLPGDYPIVGDWDGNGTVTLGVYRDGNFYLRNSNTNGFADLVIAFGAAGDQPVAGDWDGDGIDTIGLYRSSIGMFFLRNTNSTGAPDISFSLGIAGDVGIAGDWDGDGIDTTGVFRPTNGALYLKNANTTGIADIVLTYGLPGDKPITGDWNNDGIDTIGVYRNGGFYLRNSNTNGFADINLSLGINGDVPIAGNWDGLP